MPEATADALMGLGMPAQLSSVIGANPHNLTCAGTAQTTAAVLKSRNSQITTAGGATGAIPPSNAGVMEPYFIVNTTATSGVVYVPVGHTLFSTANGSITIAQNKAAILWQYKASNWAYIILA